MDSAGAVYVVDGANNRVQKFSSEGEFLLMLGGEVNRTKVELGTASEAEENLCPVDLGDVCQKGVTGTGQGQFGVWPIGSFITIDRADTPTDVDDIVYIGDVNRIQKFDTAGSYLGEIALPESGVVNSLAFNPVSEDLYFAYPPSPIAAGKAQRPFVYRLDPIGGGVACTMEVGIPGAVATDSEGSVYVFDQQAPGNVLEPGNHITRVLKFDDECKFLEPVAQNAGPFIDNIFTVRTSGIPVVTGLATASVCLSAGADVYAANSESAKSFVRAWGPPPDNPGCPPQRRAPDIEAQYAVSVGTVEASLEALINPHFWSGAQGQTTYFVRYATAACIEENGWEGACVKSHPAPPGSKLKAGVVNEGVPAGVFLTGLQPATEYLFRFAAESRDAGGEATVESQPVFGVGGKPGAPGAEGSFRTFAPPQPPGACPNDAFRTGPSASLPDCRAFEMVSPVDKEGGDIVVKADPSGNLARLDQSALSGEGITYSSFRSFGGPQGAPYSSQYLAHRQAGVAWFSEPISPPQEGTSFMAGFHLAAPYQFFAPDLSEAWVQTTTEPVLAFGGQAGFPNLYRRESAGSAFEACTTAPQDEEISPNEYEGPVLKGLSADGAVAFFIVQARMTGDAAPGDNYQLYACYQREGQPRGLRLASVLPSGLVSPLNSTPGSFERQRPFDRGHTSRLAGAVAADGSRVFWSTGADETSPGTLYVRENPSEPQSAQLHGSATGSGDLVGSATAICNTNKFVTTLTNCQVLTGQFAVGQSVSGPCLQAGSKVTEVKVELGTLKLDKIPAETCTETEITGAASNVVSNVSTDFGAFAAGQTILGTGIPADTTITEVSGSTLTLSANATETRSAAELESFSDCTEDDKACTLPISNGTGRFWAAAADGSKVIFSENQTLLEYDVEAQSTELIAEGVRGIAGASENASRIYLASNEVLSGEPNSEDDLPLAGEPNLYLYEAGGGGSFQFVATLADADVAGSLSPVSSQPNLHTARASADASHLAFTSSGEPTGYDNTDRISGEADAEVYLYDAAAGELLCASCNPGGGRPAGRLITPPAAGEYWAAAYIPGWGTSLQASRALAEDGERVFFNSYDALLPTDTNGRQDVYEWEALGSGDCIEANPAFSPRNEGCIGLISSGKSSADSELIDASADGSDVFFLTAQSLLPQDPGLYDIYDAREFGGLPVPPAPPASCEGEACQSPAPAPPVPTPASSAFQGPGNVSEGGRRHCPKGKRRVVRRGAVRCLAKKRRGAKQGKRARRRAHAERRTAR